MCTLGHVLSKMLVKCRNGTAICRGIRGVYKTVGRAGERRGDVGSFCFNYCPTISMPRKYQPSTGFEELPRPDFLSQIPIKHGTGMLRHRA